jgi:hypothetical protein
MFVLRSILIFIFIASLLFFQYSCIDEVSFPVSELKAGMNISGFITDSLFFQKITVRSTTGVGYGASVDGKPISGARVTIVSNQGISTPFNELFQSGDYVAYFKPEYGVTYQLKVVLADGHTYQSSPQLASPLKPSFSISSRLIRTPVLNTNQVIRDFEEVGIILNTTLMSGNKPLYALYRISGEYALLEDAILMTRKTCYIKENLDFNNLKVFGGSSLPGGIVREAVIYKTIADDRFYDQYCFHIDQYIVDKDTYLYFDKIAQLVQTGTNVFVTPPGYITGNIHNVADSTEKVSGYFFIGTQSSQLNFTNATKLGTQVDYRCYIKDPNQTEAKECFECLLLPNSSRIRPSYWQ